MSGTSENEDKSHGSEEDHEEDYSVNAFLHPLGGGRSDDDEHSNQSGPSAEVNPTRKKREIKSFSLAFESVHLPFEFAQNTEVLIN